MACCRCSGRRHHRCCPGARRTTCKHWSYGLLIALTTAILLTAAILLILRFAVVPTVKAKVVDARLNTFSFVPPTNNSFVFNVSVALAVRNPGGAGIKHTKPLAATFVFSDRRLGNDTAAEEGDTHRLLKTKVHVFQAAGSVSAETLGDAAAEDFRKQMNATGVFRLELRVSGEIAYVGLDGVGNKRKVGFSCPLSLPIAPPGPEVVVFHEIGCETQGPDKIFF